MSGEVVERGPGRGDQVGEKRGFWIPARIGDRTKRSRAGSGSGGAAGGSWGGLVTCMCRSEGHREDVPAGVAGGPGVASPGGAEAGDPLCHSWNPCSVGRVVATSRIGVANHSIYVLESLFCWKSRCNKEIGMSRPGNERWNPCSVGRVVATRRSGCLARGTSVGILVLLEGSLQPQGISTSITIYPLESLFCWKGRCNPTPFAPGSHSPRRTTFGSRGHLREPQAHILTLCPHPS